MRKPLVLVSSTIVLCFFALGALADVRLVELGSGTQATAPPPRFEILSQDTGILRLSFELDALALEKVEAGGEFFDAISIEEGGLRGADGYPGLPVISKLIALPAGAHARVRVLARDEEMIPGLRLFPVQPDGAERFVLDENAYLRASPDTFPDAEISEPGMMRGLSVASLQVNPVRYDPVSRETRVTRRLELEIEYEGAAIPAAEFIPESFHLLYQDMVLNYEDTGFYREGETQVGPGTYLIIYDDVPGVLDYLTPLIEWRRKQGYNVLVASNTETGDSNWQIEDYIDNTYATADPPLEFVTLVGDASGYISIPCYYESLSGYGGEGDHYYSTIVGNDILADVHVGRISVTSTSELNNVIDKIVTYETDPPITDSGWFSRAGLAGDPSSSGITTIYVNQWLKEQLLARGYTQVDTIWGGNFVSLMTTSINQGLSVFGYRGYWYMSGMASSNILSLSNGYELPFAIIVTCDTGSFADDTTCRSEAFLRASNGGGIASVGTATIGTHTRYNNCYYMGAWNGAINGQDFRVGSAHTRGKYELYNNYQLSQPSKVEIWSMWNNLMGDPATQMWTAFPVEMTVSYPNALPAEAVSVPVTVTFDGNPINGARVALYKEGEYRMAGYTDEDGFVNLPLADVSDGAMHLTVLKHNHMPYQGSLALGDVSVHAALENLMVDDDLSGDSDGNGDGRINPGEAVELLLSLRNLGSSAILNVDATLSGGEYVTIIDGDEDFGDIAAGEEVWCAEDFDILVAADAPDGEIIELNLVARNDFQSWTSLVQLEVRSAAFEYQGFSWEAGANVDPGDSGELSLRIGNVGRVAASGVTALLETSSPWIIIHDPYATYDAMGIGADGENLDDTFSMSIDPECYDGHQANFTLTLEFNDRAIDRVVLSIPVGLVNSNDPTGPDGYGYYAFDNTDTSYDLAPVYDWVELAPNYSGIGVDLGLTDFGYEQDDTKTVSMPFEFQYYGQTYNEISICSNGWAAMGETSLTLYRNWNIPGAGSPSAMIAAFWDDLYQQTDNRVYTLYDESGHRLIIQWSRLKNRATNSIQNFELILLDPAYYPTSTGDGKIIVQYNIVNNTDTTNGYGSVGIQNQDRSDGLLYTYWNSYPSSAPSLSSGRAILFSPRNDVPRPSCEVSPDHITEIAPPDETVLRTISIANQGEAGTVLNYDVELHDVGLQNWVRLSSNSGSLAVGESDDIQVTLDSGGLDEGTYRGEIRVVHNAGTSVSIPVTFIVNESGTGTDEIPEFVFLARNHPNPFNPKTSIRFGLSETGTASLAVYDMAGRLVRVLAAGSLDAGVHEYSWDGRDEAGEQVSSGIYFAKLRTKDIDLNQKMVLLK